MSDDLKAQIQGTLIDLVACMKQPDTSRMVQAMERLDGWVAEHRSAMDPRLAHFLERRSYVKALDFLRSG